MTFRLYPAPKEYNGGSDVLDQYASLSFKIYVNDNATGLKMTNEKKVLEGAAKQINYENSSQKYFEGKGKKYYEFTVEFDAQVPYRLEGWTAGEDLRKFDQKKLEEKTVNMFKDYKDNYNGKGINKIIDKSYLELLYGAITNYSTREEIEKKWIFFKENIEMNKEWYPWNYKVQFYGDGRIITLLQKDESIDYLRNMSIISFQYKLGDEEGMAYTNLFLYIPKGGSIDDLQVLR